MGICVLLARQRSGTGALGSVLDQHPELHFVGEVFHHDAVNSEPNYFHFFREMVARDPRMAFPGAAAERLDAYFAYLKGRRPQERTVVDIKYRSTHHFNGFWHGVCDDPALFRLLEARQVPIIHLTRRNVLKTYVSGLLADANRVWHARSAEELRTHTVRLNPAQTLGHLKAASSEIDRVFHALRRYPAIATFDYAELFDAQGELSSRVERKLCELLGIAPFTTRRPVFVKQVSDDLSAVIENYEEIRDALAPTHFGWMLASA
jgi:hypothetical protein